MLPGTPRARRSTRSPAEPVRAAVWSIGIAGTAILTWLNYRGAGAASRLQDVLTWALLAASAWFIIAGIWAGSGENLKPLFGAVSDRPVWRGVLSVMATAPFWYAGFDVIPQMMGERAPGSSLAGRGPMILLSIAVAGLFYVLVIIGCSMMMPWQQLVLLPMPAAEGFRRALDSELLAQVVLLAPGPRAPHDLEQRLHVRVASAVHARPRARPRAGVRRGPSASRFPGSRCCFVGIVSAAAVPLGRGALIPIVNVAGICLAAAALLVCIGVIRYRRTSPEPDDRTGPGGSATAAAAAIVCLWMVGWALIEPGVRSRLPIEW